MNPPYFETNAIIFNSDIKFKLDLDLFRGANTKTEMSMVDRIELARAYQPLTGL